MVVRLNTGPCPAIGGPPPSPRPAAAQWALRGSGGVDGSRLSVVLGWLVQVARLVTALATLQTVRQQ